MHACLTPRPSSPRCNRSELPGHNPQSTCDEISGKKTCSEDPSTCLPPIVHQLSLSANRARNKFEPYNKPQGPSALELRFTERSLGRFDSNDITLEDAQAGKSIFLRGLMGLSDKAIRQALAARQADRESKRLRALATAWEIEASARHTDFLLAVQEANAQQVDLSSEEVMLFEKMLERRSAKELEDDIDFNSGAYSHDLMSLEVSDERLDQLQTEVTRRQSNELPVEDESPDRLAAILSAAITAEPDEPDLEGDAADDSG